MGFKDVREMVIHALKSGSFAQEPRPDIGNKNLLHAKEVTVEYVIGLLRRCSGDDYESSRHHSDPSLICHIFTPERRGERWYVKVYFLGSIAVFISVHPS